MDLPEAIRTSWLSLAAVPLVWLGYVLLLALGWRIGYLFLAASQVVLVAIGVVHGEWALALLIVPVTLPASLYGWWRAGRPDPKVVRLERRIAELERRAA